MDAFELNKVFGAITGAMVVFFGVSFLIEGMYGPGHGGGHHGDDHGPKLAYAIEIEEDVVEEEEEVEVISLASLMLSADVDKGAKVFGKCKACHKIESGGANGTGPALWGVMGREVGVHPGYSYSSAFAERTDVWGWEEMNAFLTKPKDWEPGTKMNFAGLKKPADRANLMAYLNANGDSPLAPPVE